MRRLLRNFALYLFHVGFVRPVLFWVVGTRYRRRNQLPKGPCLVASNHNSHLDAALLMTLFPLRRLPHVHPVAAADYFGTNWLRRTMAMVLMNALPIQRHASAGRDPLTPIVDALKAGKSLVFFPEGSRGEAGVVARFRPGIGRLAHKFPGLLVVPVFLSGPERILPRGHVVPVPLDIEVVVGRPRTYSVEDDPSTIAEKVREAVLNLAPPPPPPPEERPAPPIRVAVCGVEGTARIAVYEEVIRRLSGIARTMGIADPVVEADGDGVREVTGLPSRRLAWLGLLARAFRTTGRFKGARFAEMVVRAQLDESLGPGRGARFVVTDGSALVDLMAWAMADFYQGKFDESGMHHLMKYLAGERKIPFSLWWSFVRRAPEVWLVSIFNLARPPVPDLVVLVRRPIEQVMEGLRSRGEELQPFENERFLSALHESYGQVGNVLAKRRKVQVIEVDPGEDGFESAFERLETVCRELSEHPLAASSP